MFHPTVYPVVGVHIPTGILFRQYLLVNPSFSDNKCCEISRVFLNVSVDEVRSELDCIVDEFAVHAKAGTKTTKPPERFALVNQSRKNASPIMWDWTTWITGWISDEASALDNKIIEGMNCYKLKIGGKFGYIVGKILTSLVIPDPDGQNLDKFILEFTHAISKVKSPTFFSEGEVKLYNIENL